MSEVTVQQLEELCKQMRELDDEIEKDKEALSEKNKKYTQLEAQAAQWLKELGKGSYKSNFGTVIRQEKWRVNLPQTPEDRDAFFGWLKERGLFEHMITVNSNTLNSLYMKEWEVAKESPDPVDALTFSIPGIPEPKLHETVSLRRK
jgi:hypothetical protein